MTELPRLRVRRRARPADGRMTLVEHLYELRGRLFKAAVAVILASVLSYIYFKPIFGFIIHPYCRLPQTKTGTGHGCTLYAFSVLDQFNARLKVSLFVGGILAAPVWLYQLWKFITPGLHTKERKWAFVFVGIGSVLFAFGTILAYFALYTGLEFLLSIGGGSVTTLLDVSGYLRYITAMVLVFGLAFEFPLVLCMLNMVGVLPHARLAGWRRQAIFLGFLFAALATPGQDPFGMLALGGSLWLLYELTLLITRVHDKRKARREARRRADEGWENIGDDETSPVDPQPSDLSDIS
ncbi:MAG: twin-arginine translocase subunit TatC [Actinomycetota bacterium]|nr:twin-arginine translocase subunit TatC [Actinomycetota bacterium]